MSLVEFDFYALFVKSIRHIFVDLVELCNWQICSPAPTGVSRRVWERVICRLLYVLYADSDFVRL